MERVSQLDQRIEPSRCGSINATNKIYTKKNPKKKSNYFAGRCMSLRGIMNTAIVYVQIIFYQHHLNSKSWNQKYLAKKVFMYLIL